VFQLHSTAIDDDQDMGGQSADCEAPPPPYTASYTNLFDTSQDVPLGGSAHSLRNHMTGDSPRGARRAVAPPHSLATRHSPMGQRRMEPQPPKRIVDPYRAPMATPDQFSPNTPSPSGYNVPPPAGYGHPVPAGVHMVKSTSVERSLAADEKYPTNQALITDHSGALGVPRSGSHNRLTSAGAAAHSRGVRTSPVAQRYQRAGGKPPAHSHPHQHYNASNGVGGGSVAGSVASMSSGRPQHHQVQPQPQRAPKESGYSSSSTQASFKPPPPPSSMHQQRYQQHHPHPHHHHHHHQQPHRPPSENRGVAAEPIGAEGSVGDIPGIVRRPMSFVRALEMSDAIAVQERHRQQRQQQQQNTLNVSTEDEKNYGSTYEISV
jgi:hypothetical protein